MIRPQLEPSHRNASFELLDAIHTVGERIDAEPGSWLYKMAPLLNDRSAFTPVLWRVSDFTLNLTLPQLIQYDIESPRDPTLHDTAILRALRSANCLMPEIKIFPISGRRVDVNGTLLDGVDKEFNERTRRLSVLHSSSPSPTRRGWRS